MPEAALRDVSDTALLVAYHRALESERRDAAFHDPFARRLAGDRGAQIARSMWPGLAGWPVIPRTVVFDEWVLRSVRAGRFDVVLNLAAGLDSRPYRLDLPGDLRWIEADLPGLLEYKAERLSGARPRCQVERVAADLTDAAACERVLDLAEGLSALVLTEGLLVYLSREDAASLATALAARPAARRWLLDLAGPAAVQWSGRGGMGRALQRARAAHRFGPAEGPDFFRPLGWEPVETRSSWEEARRLGRLPWPLRALAAITPTAHRSRYQQLTTLVLLEPAR
ncbi:MAG TPA: SAM-dependent methyltransferase [Candidatus Dormibacteraeota bacterium]|nr:SAM-dependent methyltransferase [Candidatus Dormibacteraeota bacterium]